ncbi:MAG: FliH/SctL family protein [Opitutaceae bacterium]
MSFSQYCLVTFDRPLLGATIPGNSSRLYSESEMSVIKAEAYREGYDTAHAFSDRQLLEFREEVQALQHGLLQTLPNIERSMLDQLRSSLPELVLEIARRLLAGYEPPAELVQKLCVETLDQLFPERENLELIVSTRDAALLTKNMKDLEARYPGLRVRPDTALSPGDCQVRSRFGLTDARQSAKLESLRHELVGAA